MDGYTYRYPHPAVTVDCVVFGLDEGTLKVLLIRRKNPPFLGAFALPGGYVEIDEGLESAARRELMEETGVSNLYLEQLMAFGDPGRDPRERVITVAYLSVVNLADHEPQAGSDATEARWFAVEHVPKMAFDHGTIVSAGLERLRMKLRHEPLVFAFLPETFALRQIDSIYETVLCRSVDGPKLRKMLKESGFLIAVETDESMEALSDDTLYRFDRERYVELAELGFEFRV